MSRSVLERARRRIDEINAQIDELRASLGTIAAGRNKFEVKEVMLETQHEILRAVLSIADLRKLCAKLELEERRAELQAEMQAMKEKARDAKATSKRKAAESKLTNKKKAPKVAREPPVGDAPVVFEKDPPRHTSTPEHKNVKKGVSNTQKQKKRDDKPPKSNQPAANNYKNIPGKSTIFLEIPPVNDTVNKVGYYTKEHALNHLGFVPADLCVNGGKENTNHPTTHSLPKQVLKPKRISDSKTNGNQQMAQNKPHGSTHPFAQFLNNQNSSLNYFIFGVNKPNNPQTICINPQTTPCNQPTHFNTQTTTYNPQLAYFNTQTTSYNPQPTYLDTQTASFNPQPTIVDTQSTCFDTPTSSFNSQSILYDQETVCLDEKPFVWNQQPSVQPPTGLDLQVSALTVENVQAFNNQQASIVQ